MKITVLGASGFIGRHLCAVLRARGDTVTITSLRDPAAAALACSGVDVVVNLAGEAVSQRWTPRAKALIRASRVDAPRALLAELAKADKKPGAYVSASAIGYYGTSDTATFDETSGSGVGFLADICAEWEAQADRAADLGMRVAKMRTGIVLGTDGGALAALLPIFKLGLGGPVASGKQWYSWIHIDGADGVLNATAPAPVRNSEFTSALAKSLHRPAFVPVPAFAMRLMFGEGGEIVTDGQRVLPTRSLATGYRFKYETIEFALNALFAS